MLRYAADSTHDAVRLMGNGRHDFVGGVHSFTGPTFLGLDTHFSDGAELVVDAGGLASSGRLVFDQAAYQDQDRADRPTNAGGYELVEWDEWFKVFDENRLALVVEEEVPGRRDNYHQFVRRSD